jgi:hypothetical protein
MTSLGFLGIVFHFIRHGRMKVQYALLWLLFGILMMMLSFSPSLLNRLAEAMDIHYAPSLLFLFGIMISLILILHLTVIVSNLSERVVRLTQELGILKNETRNYFIHSEQQSMIREERLEEREPHRKSIL